MLPVLLFPFRYTDDMELEDAVHTAILTLKEGYDAATFMK
jgi:hypothetical protein